MNEHRSPQRPPSNGLPAWLNTTAVLVFLGLFSYNVLVVGEKGYPTNVLLSGLLGLYIGVDQYKRRASANQPPSEGGDDG